MNTLILIFIFLFILLCKINIKSALLLLIFALPSYLIRFKLFSFPSTLLEVMILIVFAFFIYNNRKQIIAGLKSKEKNKIKYPFSIEIVLILVFAYIASYVGGMTNAALGIFKAYFLEPIFLYIVILNTFKHKKDISKIILALAVSAILMSALAIWQNFTGGLMFNEHWSNPENRRVISFYNYPNALALYLGPIIALSFFSFIARTKRKLNLYNISTQAILMAATIMGLMAVYFSKSKGALIAIAISFLLSAYFFLSKKIKVFIFLIVILSSTSLIIHQQDWIKTQLSSSLSYQIRISQWQSSMEMLKNEGIIKGAGLANYQNKIKAYHAEGIFLNKDKDPDFARKIVIFDDEYKAAMWQPIEVYLYPHNIILNFWTEIGLIATLVFLILILRFLIKSFHFFDKSKSREERYINLGLFNAMLIIVIHGMVDVPYFKNDLSAMFWIILSLLAIYIIKNKEKNAAK